MTPKRYLFDLIRSLTEAERVFVGKALARPAERTSTDLRSLFQALCRQATFDEDALRKRYPDAPFIRRLAATKHRLYRRILPILRQYRAETSAFQRATAALDDATFLWERGLYDQAADRLTDADRAARSMADTALLLRIQQFQLRIELLRGASTDGATQLLHAIDHSIRGLREEQSMRHLRRSIYALHRREGTALPAAQRQQASAYGRELARRRSMPPASPMARLDLLDAVAAYAMYVEGAIDEAVQADRERLDLLERTPALTVAQPEAMVIMQSTLCQRLVRAQRRTEALAILSDMRTGFTTDPPPTGSHRWHEGLQRLVSTEIFVLLTGVSTERSAARLPELMRDTQALHANRPSQPTMVSLFNLAMMAFTLGWHTDALRCLDSVLPFDRSVRPDVHVSARHLRAMIFADQGAWSLVASQVRSTRRLAASLPEPTADERLLTSCLARMADEHRPRRRLVIARQTLAAIDALRADGPPFLRTDTIAAAMWLEAMVTATPFADVIRQRYP